MSWTLRTAASTDYRLEFYGANDCDASGRGEAKELIATRAGDDRRHRARAGLGQVVDGRSTRRSIAVTATVTDPNGVVLGPTSELSALRLI